MFTIKLVASRLLRRSLIVMALTALLASATARAEFKPGDIVPAFSLEAADGLPLSVTRREGNVFLIHGTKRLRPKLLVIHLLQPDCLQCRAQMRALEGLYQEFGRSGVVVVGIAHRGDIQRVRALAREIGVTFPLAAGTGSQLAKQFAAGDTLGIADSGGVMRFAQVGYGQGDEKVWRENITLLLAGKPVREQTLARTRLRVGDQLPAIRLDSLISGKPMALTGEGGLLTFRDEAGTVIHPKAAVGFFSRL